MIDTKWVEAYADRVIRGEITVTSEGAAKFVVDIHMMGRVYRAAAAVLAAERDGGTQNQFQAAMKVLREVMK